MKPHYLSVLTWTASTLFTAAENGPESHSSMDSLNPSISVVIDGFHHYDDSREGMPHLKEEMSGFGHAHEDDHAHGDIENGFNLREVELYVSGELDGYFAGEATFAFHEDDVEVETAFFQTTSLPWGFRIKGGKFFSGFGAANNQHPHQWAFTDRPLIHELVFGDHGLLDIGAQLTWTASAPFHLSLGAETFQGENEAMFAQAEDGEMLPSHDGPRLGVGWLKAGPAMPHGHSLLFGLFGAAGRHQEIHEETIGTNDYFDGTSYFVGGDMHYVHHAHGERGQGDFDIQSEYLYRNKDLDLDASNDPGAPLGERLDSSQDGYHIQARYGFLPGWRCGFRWDQVGLTNQLKEPGEAGEQFGESWRATAMLDYSPTPHALIRFQASNGDYETEEGTENVWESFVQLVITIGPHRHPEGHACTH